MQQQGDEHAAIVLAPRCAEALDQQFLKARLREGRRLSLLDLGQALAPYAVPGFGGRGICSPGVAEEGAAPTILIGRLIRLPVKGAPRIARIHLGRLGAHFAQPIEEVGQVGDDVAGVLGRARRPTQAARVESRLTVEGAGVEPLSEVLEQAIGVALGRVGLEVL
jgi:hypothetical protein